MDKIWDRKSFEVAQNRQTSNAKTIRFTSVGNLKLVAFILET